MPQKLMDVLMLGRCSHEFSWPRRGGDGNYYQVCLLCAAEYKYDWTTMNDGHHGEIVSSKNYILQRLKWEPYMLRQLYRCVLSFFEGF